MINKLKDEIKKLTNENNILKKTKKEYEEKIESLNNEIKKLNNMINKLKNDLIDSSVSNKNVMEEIENN